MMMTSKQTGIITKKELTRMSFNVGGLGMEWSWNYPRQMHMAFLLMLDPSLKKIYANNPEGYKEALVRHMEFFNITPQLAPFVGGIVLSMEEEVNKGDISGDGINGIKAALMGPLSGIGDSIFLGCIRVIALGVGLSLAQQGNILGPILYVLIYNVPAFLIRVFGARLGYNLGFNYLTKAQENGTMDKLMYAAGILGIMVIGSMTFDMFWATVSLKIGSGDSVASLQEVLDGIMPGIVGLGVTWLYYWALGKKVGPVKLILITVVVGIALAYFGVMSA
ncbi:MULTISPECIES: PTS system mannose/fructose/sorbose family transporter subunit IID [unclassified Breznakia]|uniref:PTS system mannose/fructose/sorbose family transporter subunit IID n=1 Tax=unclassified Breznakia TaxID=2623764 RepID=UPI002406E466|nr:MULTISPECIES: PTS system mannose/fructose/sorbose family transporter subunit IID [unclassified Breznakia]MDL2276242.1 PTS system mannose/fructose/sorbose family transporter subunit IID [Breznakia sp. OttesenSCG-928-G09]